MRIDYGALDTAMSKKFLNKSQILRFMIQRGSLPMSECVK